jgi:DNA invertase Pin-like site-specific DNA recombinase
MIVRNKIWAHVPSVEGPPAPVARVSALRAGAPTLHLRGSKHPQAKLTEGDIPRIREMFEEGISKMRIAKLFGVSDTTILNILRGKKWKHVMSDWRAQTPEPSP